MCNVKKFFRVVLPCLLVSTIPLTVNAQLEEIVVTAQKRSESLQDVPVAVTAFTADTMEALGITEASDLVLVTPGLQSTSQAGSNRNYFLRGVGTADFHLTAAPAIGQYYDGVTLTSGFQARAALFDMERVEVLKGPQNTLFGLNTTGGAVNYISRKPEIGGGTTGRFLARIGSESYLNTEGAVGFELSDNAAARLAFTTNKYDGFESITDGVDRGDDDMKAYRASVLWQPNDKSSLLFNLHGMTNDNNGGANKGLGTRAPDGSGARCADFNNGIQDFDTDTNCISRDGAGSGQPGTDPSTGAWELLSSTYGLEDIDTKGFFVKYDYDFDWATLNLMGAFDNLDFRVAADTDAGPTVGVNTNQSDDRDTLQYEARLVSPSDKPFRWIAGVYYLDEDAFSYTGVRSPGIGMAVTLPNVQLDHTRENLGLYFQGEVDVSDNFTVTAGVRWSDEEIVGNYLPSSPNVLGTEFGLTVPIFADTIDQFVREQADPTNPNQDANGYDVRRQVTQILENDDVGYTFKLDWKPTDDSLLYAGFSKGFKGGALDIRAAYALVPPTNLVDGLVPVDPESLESFELGYKGSFWDNRISVDASAFFYSYENLARFTTAQGTPTLANAPESEVSGLDANVKYANDSGFYVDVGVAFMTSELTDATDSIFQEGFELGNVPEFSASLVAAQDFEMGDNLLTVALNVNHKGDYQIATLALGENELVDMRTQPSYTILNLNATYRFGDDQQYSFQVFGNNLTDEHYCHQRGTQGGNTVLDQMMPGNALSGVITCTITRETERQYGIGFTVDF